MLLARLADRQWMIERENPVLPTKVSDPASQFWIKQAAQKPGGKPHWLNVATRSPQWEDPVLGRGGIIADGMGLGKTLSYIALVLATKSDKVTKGEGATLIGKCLPAFH
jgi:SWI/SNF-related matrix-associated actin-dependent regulator of chromatin subfamily A3